LHADDGTSATILPGFFVASNTIGFIVKEVKVKECPIRKSSSIADRRENEMLFIMPMMVLYVVQYLKPSSQGIFSDSD
jgi:hypothetical protein